MACEYCNGKGKQLTFQPCSDPDGSQAFIEPDGAPAICVLVDSAWVYININNCPMCGDKLGGDSHE